jgi:hypothetical protein
VLLVETPSARHADKITAARARAENFIASCERRSIETRSLPTGFQ